MSIQAPLFFMILSMFNLSFANCITNPFQKSKLPKEMPERLKIRYSENGGMAPEWYGIDISKNQILFTEKKMDDEKEKKFYTEISDEDKTNLYKVFVKNKFDLIKNDERTAIVYDAESEDISILAGKVSKNVSYGKNSPLSKSNLKRYSAVKSAVKDLEAKYQGKLKKISENTTVIEYSPRKHKYIFKKGTYTKLTQTEIVMVETLVEKAIAEHNSKQTEANKIKDLDKYKRQFIPSKNENGETVVWTNYFCQAEKLWKWKILTVTDGGNCYFNLYVNLTKNSTEKLSVNGEA